jgi:hypothetical protein
MLILAPYPTTPNRSGAAQAHRGKKQNKDFSSSLRYRYELRFK